MNAQVLTNLACAVVTPARMLARHQPADNTPSMRTLKVLANSVCLICNAFLLFFVIMCIFSVMAVKLSKSLLAMAYGAHDWTVYLSAWNQDDVVLIFFSFKALVGIIAFNIIVAVMLQGFASSMQQAYTNGGKGSRWTRKRQVSSFCVLNPECAAECASIARAHC